MPKRKYISKEDNKEFHERRRNLQLFSKYYEGVILSPTMRYSVTREAIANKIASKVVQKGYHYVTDACGGAAGNTIAFALAGLNVAYVDLVEENVESAINNADVYEVSDYIYFQHGDIFEFDSSLAGLDSSEAFFFCSPEWGGPSYKNDDVFDLEDLQPPLSKLLQYVKLQGYKEACFYVPRTSNIYQAEAFGCHLFEYMFHYGWCDAVCMWFKFE